LHHTKFQFDMKETHFIMYHMYQNQRANNLHG